MIDREEFEKPYSKKALKQSGLNSAFSDRMLEMTHSAVDQGFGNKNFVTSF